MQKLLIASQNKGKVREIKAILSGIPLNMTSMNDFPTIDPVEETGRSFMDNAILKAKYYS